MTEFQQRLISEISSLQVDIRLLRNEVQEIRAKQEKLVAQSNRWRGGLAVVLILGGIFAWLMEYVTNIYMGK